MITNDVIAIFTVIIFSYLSFQSYRKDHSILWALTIEGFGLLMAAVILV